MKTEEQMLRDDLAQCEADGEQMSTELAKLREAVKTLRKAASHAYPHLRDLASRKQQYWDDAGPALIHLKAALAATANLVED